MQGFFIRVSAEGTTTLSLPASNKTSSATAAITRFKGSSSGSKGSSDVKKVKLVLNNGTRPDQTIVCLFDDATDEFDGDHDAFKFMGSDPFAPFIYSKLDDIKYATNAVSPPVDEPKVIPLILDIKENLSYSIDITEFDNLGDYQVILKHGSVETILGPGVSYPFTLSPGLYTDFSLNIVSGATVGVENPLSGDLKAWYSKGNLYINSPDDLTSNKTQLEVLNLQGKPVFRQSPAEVYSGETLQIPLSLTKGVYIVKIINDNKQYISKIVSY